MKFKSQVYTQASGSVGGVTYSRNRFGMYTRARSVPVNPNTPLQQAARNRFQNAVAFWQTFPQSRKDTWNVYAANVPVINSLGDQVFLTGQNMFIRQYVANVQAGEPVPDVASDKFNKGILTSSLAFNAVEANDDIVLTFDNTENIYNINQSGVMIFVGRPQNDSVNFFKGPYRYAGFIAGNATTPPTSPVTLSGTWPIQAGQRVFVRYRTITSNNRLSDPVDLQPVIATA